MNNSGGRLASHRRSGERGQTIILVAVSLVSLLGMAALAIDVVTLYVARSEMQRAADAAALAGAKAFVDSGVTSLATTDPNYAAVQGMAQTMAASVIRDILPQNRISGKPPLQAAGSPAFDLTRPGNPQVTVTLQRTDLPTFFSRIWGSRLATVSATAIAEAYNASGSQASTGTYVPVTPKCVKPLLVINQDPKTLNALIDPITGLPATGVVGEQITLYPACTGTGGVGTCTAITPTNPPQANVPNPGDLPYLAAEVNPNANNLCPSCQGAANFEQSIECCDFNPYSCGAAYPKINIDTVIRHGQLRNDTNNGVQCLISGTPDTLDPTSLPGFSAGTEPLRIRSNNGPHSGTFVTTSASIVTLPIIDRTLVTTQVTVLGFLQVFVDDPIKINSGPAGNHTEVPAHILNVVGCGNNPGAGASVSGGGISPIPVRLIHQ
jgi:hypothetical protein